MGIFDQSHGQVSWLKDIICNRVGGEDQFTSRVWSSFMEKLGVSVNLLSGYNPQSNRQVEIVNQDIGCFLRTFCSENKGDWAQFLLWVEYAQTSCAIPPHASLHFTACLYISCACSCGMLAPQNWLLLMFWFRCCEQVWERMHWQLEQIAETNRQLAGCHQGFQFHRLGMVSYKGHPVAYPATESSMPITLAPIKLYTRSVSWFISWISPGSPCLTAQNGHLSSGAYTAY